MIRVSDDRPARPGLTAIELLVVFSILAILLALAGGAVMMVRGSDMAATTNTEIREMVAGLEAFRTKFGGYPPSQATFNPNAVDPELQRLWPSIDIKSVCASLGVTSSTSLSGDQCLVLFLGGRHDSNGVYGLSTSKRNPFDAAGDREGPFFKFKPNRLKANAGSPFYSYSDGFAKSLYNGQEMFPIYAYFAPGRKVGYRDGDCAGLADPKGATPKPYKDAAGEYLNRQSFQILSSGRNLLWGTGRNWTPGTGVGEPDGNDNISNFAGGPLAGG